MIIGIDFDNTIICYDPLFYHVALKQGYIDHGCAKNKRAIRELIRNSRGGEQSWQKLQADVYGIYITEAKPFKGVREFLQKANQRGISVYVISHKTEHASQSQVDVNLRRGAKEWMKRQKFIGGTGIQENHLFFENTRQEKLERIRKMRCNVFIDDLEETFEEPSFPEKVQKILFDPHYLHPHSTEYFIIHTWQEITCFIFNGRH